MRYYCINRVSYTARELSAITVGPRRLFLPALVARLFVLKVIGKDVPIGDPIADTRPILPTAIHEAAEIRERHVAFQRAESTPPALGFADIRYFCPNDPRSPHESHNLFGIDSSNRDERSGFLESRNGSGKIPCH